MSQFASSIAKELPPWPTDFEEPSDLYKLVVTNSDFPPLMQKRAWNLAVPFKEQRLYHTPSESIANNYTPSASLLKIRSLPKRFLKDVSASVNSASKH
jgi:dynein heavy chain